MGKKKGAGNKLAKMSEEERLRYLQHRAEIEEEARRRKQQLISIFMKNKLKREEAFARLNLAKINQEWRSILRNIKCEELKSEIKSVEEYFEDALTRKNDTIQRLLSDLDENEEMYSTMLHAHMENIERLIALHSDRIAFLKTSYLDEKKSMLNQYHKEIQTYKERKIKAHVELECVFYGLESIADNDRDRVRDRHLKQVDDVKS
ncbi:Dynein regulatory complex subunit 2, partial [Pseudolycoriella hygida]